MHQGRVVRCFLRLTIKFSLKLKNNLIFNNSHEFLSINHIRKTTNGQYELLFFLHFYHTTLYLTNIGNNLSTISHTSIQCSHILF